MLWVICMFVIALQGQVHFTVLCCHVDGPRSSTCPSIAGLQTSETVLDLFCGAGTFALALASQCASVQGIEVTT